jgi:hypothetical protein
MSSETNKRSYDYYNYYNSDTSSQSSCPDSPVMLPMVGLDENGCQKLVSDERTANEVRRKVTLDKSTAMVTKEDTLLTTDRKAKKGTHGLSPKGMSLPHAGAYRVGRAMPKQPLKESNQEKFNRIKLEREKKNIRKNQISIKKLKREGKVSTLASFMYS